MRDLKETEPKIEILFPLLAYCSPEAAILYGYLKSIAKIDALKGSRNEDVSNHLATNRWQIKGITGLSNGKQIDAEQDLVGAGLVQGFSDDEGNVEYYIHPENEEKLRRFFNSRSYAWSD
jgi:hypothetical protein